MSAKQKRTRWNSCNVLEVAPDSRLLWSFTAGKNGFSFDREQTFLPGGPLPARLVAKDWKNLFQPRLNIALLPVDKVFLRVVQLPIGELSETVSMAELQLEKLSPLPVTQIVWSIHVLPHTVDNLQTVIVIIAARDVVEELIGQLESQGYLADRLELPVLDQLLATPITGDGAWIYPSGGDSGKLTALVAWWYGGVLRHLGLIHVPPVESRADNLKEQLTQMAWAGELEGWLTSPPHWYLVADENAAANWQPMFRAWLGQSAELITPLTPPELAALTANRAARAETGTNILPVEFSSRYRQQFVDRLWMRGLGGVLAVYVMGVMIYMAALAIQTSKADSLETQAGSMSREYTNTLKLKAQLAILQDREDLKFASLDCWKMTAEFLPEGFIVQSLGFQNGKLSLSGTAPADARRKVSDFADAMRKATKDTQLVFSKVDVPNTSLNPAGNQLAWSFTCELARKEAAR